MEPPTFRLTVNPLYLLPLISSECGGKPEPRSKPTQTRGEHVNSTHKIRFEPRTVLLCSDSANHYNRASYDRSSMKCAVSLSSKISAATYCLIILEKNRFIFFSHLTSTKCAFPLSSFVLPSSELWLRSRWMPYLCPMLFHLSQQSCGH